MNIALAMFLKAIVLGLWEYADQKWLIPRKRARDAKRAANP